eukprot:SM000034S12702  [mRNA]  locus=s34:331916:332430:+ [translate_table: standard]
MGCPLRVILVVASALVAAYLAWRNLKTDVDGATPKQQHLADDKQPAAKENRPLHTKVLWAMWDCLLVFIDFATGRYLWQTFSSSSRSQPRQEVQKKMC